MHNLQASWLGSGEDVVVLVVVSKFAGSMVSFAVNSLDKAVAVVSELLAVKLELLLTPPL